MGRFKGSSRRLPESEPHHSPLKQIEPKLFWGEGRRFQFLKLLPAGKGHKVVPASPGPVQGVRPQNLGSARSGGLETLDSVGGWYIAWAVIWKLMAFTLEKTNLARMLSKQIKQVQKGYRQ